MLLEKKFIVEIDKLQKIKNNFNDFKKAKMCIENSIKECENNLDIEQMLDNYDKNNEAGLKKGVL